MVVAESVMEDLRTISDVQKSTLAQVYSFKAQISELLAAGYSRAGHSV